MSGFLHHLAVCNAHDPAEFVPLDIGAHRIGCVRHEVAARLADFGFYRTEDGLALDEAPFDALSETFGAAASALREAGLAAPARGELYSVLRHPDAAPLATIDRGAATEFGILNKGFHLNGVVRKASGLHMWIARRAFDKATYPGKLDNMVAGGHPHGISAFGNLLKECHEEAGIPESIAAEARPTGVISYQMAVPAGLRRHMFYTYDLDLNEDFVPEAVDGEVHAFMLMPIEEVAEIVEKEVNAFKYNCNLAIIDYLVRHGLIGPDHPDYFDIASGLRRPVF